MNKITSISLEDCAHIIETAKEVMEREAQRAKEPASEQDGQVVMQANSRDRDGKGRGKRVREEEKLCGPAGTWSRDIWWRVRKMAKIKITRPY